MTTYLLQRLAAALLLPLLILLAGCDSMGTVDETAFTITFTAEEHTAGLLFSATGAIEDAGRVEGDLRRADLAELVPMNWSGWRKLQGELGIITLAFEGEAVPGEKHHWAGRFTTLDGCTGAYAALRAGGTFEVYLDDQGRAIETFTGEMGFAGQVRQ